MEDREEPPVGLTVEEAREAAIDCAADCHWWAWGDAAIDRLEQGVFIASTPPDLPGKAYCEHVQMFEDPDIASDRDFVRAFGYQYGQAMVILKREQASVAAFN